LPDIEQRKPSHHKGFTKSQTAQFPMRYFFKRNIECKLTKNKPTKQKTKQNNCCCYTFNEKPIKNTTRKTNIFFVSRQEKEVNDQIVFA
jgi:hypothetical protein